MNVVVVRLHVISIHIATILLEGIHVIVIKDILEFIVKVFNGFYVN